MKQVDVLIFVEDPGAANMAMDLPEILDGQGCGVVLLAASHAISYLRARHIAFKEVSGNVGAGALLDKYSPKLIIVGTSENSESIGLDLIDEAQVRNMLSIALVDMACNAGRRFKGRGSEVFEHTPDRLIVPDAVTRDAFLSIGFPNERILQFGNPQYDRAWSRRNEFESSQTKREARERPRWLFIAEGFDQLNLEANWRTPEYTLSGRGDTDWRTGIVLEELLDGAAMLPVIPEIIVRLHPKSKKEEFSQWYEEISFDNSTDPYTSVWEADVVIGMTSMLLLEAAILGRPVLSILPRQSEKAWLGPLMSNQLESVFDRGSLVNALFQMSLGMLQGESPKCWARPNAAKNISNYILYIIKQ